MLRRPEGDALPLVPTESGLRITERPSPNQHSMAGEEFATDAARNYHGRDAPA